MIQHLTTPLDSLDGFDTVALGVMNLYWFEEYADAGTAQSGVLLLATGSKIEPVAQPLSTGGPGRAMRLAERPCYWGPGRCLNSQRLKLSIRILPARLAGSLFLLAALPAAAQHTCNGKTATIVGTTSADNIIGTSGNDVIQARAGDDYVRGGDDDLCGGPGNDTVIGDSGRDKVTGGDGNDFVRGGAGNDTVDGNTGTNTVWGDSGTDWCFNGSSYAACELPLCDHQPELCICDDTCF